MEAGYVTRIAHVGLFEVGKFLVADSLTNSRKAS
jgi:hypothetical protein